MCFNPSWKEVVLFLFLHLSGGVKPHHPHPLQKKSLVLGKPPVPNQLAKLPVTAHLNHFKKKSYWFYLSKAFSSHFMTSFESKIKNTL